MFMATNSGIQRNPLTFASQSTGYLGHLVLFSFLRRIMKDTAVSAGLILSSSGGLT